MSRLYASFQSYSLTYFCKYYREFDREREKRKYLLKKSCQSSKKVRYRERKGRKRNVFFIKLPMRRSPPSGLPCLYQ